MEFSYDGGGLVKEGTPCPTAEPKSCPTAASQTGSAINNWRWQFSSAAKVITYEPGDKCSKEIINPITDPGMNYAIVVNDQTYQNYVVSMFTLDPGKTLKD